MKGKDATAKDVEARIERARKHKTRIESDLREAMWFVAPDIHRDVDTRSNRVDREHSSPTMEADGDSSILQTSIASELSSDFATVLINAAMPENEAWLERRKGAGMDDRQWKNVQARVQEADASIFSAMRASNLYAVFGEIFDPHASLGTVAVHVDLHGTLADPVRVIGVPAGELELDVGPTGDVDFRAIVKQERYSGLPVLAPNVKWTSEIAKKIEKSPQAAASYARCWWRDRSASVETWREVIVVDGETQHEATLTGIGPCPLVVGRIGRRSNRPWGYGWLLRALPDLRQFDALDAGIVDNVDMTTRPPISYPDDSFASIEGGIEAGAAYPVRPGSEGAIRNLYEVTPVNPALVERDVRIRRLRKLAYVDYPEQRGDTPPSATQWADEMAMAQRRLGVIGMPFWREFAVGLFERFRGLLERSGKIEKFDGLPVYPANPLQRAGEMQEVADNIRFLGTVAPIFPEEFKATIDGLATMLALKDRMRANLVKPRQAQDVERMVGILSQFVGSAPGEASLSPTGLAPQ